MAPNNDPRQPAARKHAQAKFERHTVPHLLQELKALEQSGIGSHYISHTTDLSLLTEKFAEKEKSTTINLSPFPSIVVSGIKSVLSDNTKTQNTMTALAPISTKIGVSIRNALTVPSDILGLRQGKSKGDTLEIVATRKAFELNVAKKSIIPGMLSLSGSHPFANEQEVHGLEYVSPFEISAPYTSAQLRKSLLVEVSPSSYETTPDMDKTA